MAAGFTWWDALEKAQKACASDLKNSKADGADTEGQVDEPNGNPKKKERCLRKRSHLDADLACVVRQSKFWGPGLMSPFSQVL